MVNSKAKAGSTVITELRRNAEAHLQAKFSEGCFSPADAETRRLVNELEVHQIELEMQNVELRHARFELETALERYTDLYEFAPTGYVTLDSNGIIGTMNLACASLIGGVRSALIGRHFSQFVATKRRPVFTDFLDKVLACKIKESCEVELMNGGAQPVIVQIEAMATASGQEFRLSLINITERRHAGDLLAIKQRELEELNSSLERRIEQAVNENRRKDQILIVQDRRAAMGEMISNIAHQWRQPLNVLGLYQQDLPFTFGTAEFTREYLLANVSKSMQLINHMSETIDDFRDFFKVDKEKVAFSVNEVIRKVLALIEESFKCRSIFIVLHLECSSIVSGYPNEYAQVLINILMNARDALIEQNVDAASILIHSFDEGGRTVVTITDNANGIVEKVVDKIFDPYFTTKEPDKGTGIGLFMSKIIIEKNMGGKLMVHNTEIGAQFRIEL